MKFSDQIPIAPDREPSMSTLCVQNPQASNISMNRKHKSKCFVYQNIETKHLDWLA